MDWNCETNSSFAEMYSRIDEEEASQFCEGRW